MQESARPGEAGGPVVTWANWYSFQPHEHIRHPRVMSTCFIWATGGSGLIISAGQPFHISPRTLLRLPWAHDIEYRPDARNPYRLGTVHLVPWHSYSIEVTPVVAHRPDDDFTYAEHRSGLPNAVRTAMTTPASTVLGRHLTTLCTYVADRFSEGPFDEGVFRALGEVIARETTSWTGEPTQEARASAPFMRMTEYIISHLNSDLSVGAIAGAGGCSPTTAERLFSRHAGSSIQVSVRQARMQRAALLLRTSGLRVSEICSHVGYSDPLYFSRVFRQTFGVPPSRFVAEMGEA
jgi:AraC-like DNA-binding protein